METRVRLLINKAMLFGYSWDDLENYLSLSKSTLTEEINKFFRSNEDSKIRVEAVIQKIEENEKLAKKRTRVVLQM